MEDTSNTTRWCYECWNHHVLVYDSYLEDKTIKISQPFPYINDNRDSDMLFYVAIREKSASTVEELIKLKLP